jgi:hypothetical protein
MPIPPCDFTALHRPAGIREDILKISPIAKFVPPAALFALQRLLDSGNPLTMQLTDHSWMLLACLDADPATHAVTAASRYTHTCNIEAINAAIAAFAASVFATTTAYPKPAIPARSAPRRPGSHPMTMSMPKPMPLKSRQAPPAAFISGKPLRVAPPPTAPAPAPLKKFERVAPPPPPPPPTPSGKFEFPDHAERRMLEAIQDCIVASQGTVTVNHFDVVYKSLLAMGAPLATSAVREFTTQHLPCVVAGRKDAIRTLKSVIMATYV